MVSELRNQKGQEEPWLRAQGGFPTREGGFPTREGGSTPEERAEFSGHSFVSFLSVTPRCTNDQGAAVSGGNPLILQLCRGDYVLRSLVSRLL